MRPWPRLTLRWADVLWPDDGSSGFLHRFAVRRSVAGLGGRLLGWASDAVRAEGREWLRLDCVADNTALRAYYERAGFRHFDDVSVSELKWSAGPLLISRYERRAAR